MQFSSLFTVELPVTSYASLCNGLFSLGANFLKWWTLSFSRDFPDLEIHEPIYWKFSSERHFVQSLATSYSYMNTIITCHAYACSTSTVIIVLYSCMVITYMCTCTEASKNSWSFCSICAQSIQSHVTKPFLAQGVNRLQYKHPHQAMSRACT